MPEAALRHARLMLPDWNARGDGSGHMEARIMKRQIRHDAHGARKVQARIQTLGPILILLTLEMAYPFAPIC